MKVTKILEFLWTGQKLKQKSKQRDENKIKIYGISVVMKKQEAQLSLRVRATHYVSLKHVKYCTNVLWIP